MQAHPNDRALVVVESMFGNTRAIAEAIADDLAPHFDHVDVLDVADAPSTIEGVSLLVVGAPTHAFGMSRPSTRDGAQKQGAPPPAGRGVREWLAALQPAKDGLHTAVFDTRLRKSVHPGLRGSCHAPATPPPRLRRAPQEASRSPGRPDRLPPASSSGRDGGRRRSSPPLLGRRSHR